MKNITTITTTGGIGNIRTRNGFVNVDTVFLMVLDSILKRLVTHCLHPLAECCARKPRAEYSAISQLAGLASSSPYRLAVSGSWQPMQPFGLEPAFAIC